MLTPYPFSNLLIWMTGGNPLFAPERLSKVLDAYESSPQFAPEEQSISEHRSDPYDPQFLANLAKGTPSQVTVSLRRKHVVKHETRIDLGHRPTIRSSFSPKSAARKLPLIFEFSMRVAEAFEPDFGVVHPLSEVKPPPKSDIEKLHLQIDAGTNCAPATYRDEGPGGLGLRTFIGPYLIDQIGRERLLSLPSPAITTELPWGGLCIDVMREPWNQDAQSLRTSWRSCMNHLRPAGFFVEIEIRDSGARRYVVPDTPGRDPGGQVR